MPVGALLAMAICIEVAGTCALRQSDGFTRWGWVALMLVCYTASFYLLSLIVREMQIGLAYAIWAAAGTAIIAVLGVVLFDERLSPLAIVGIGFVVAGMVLINLASATH